MAHYLALDQGTSSSRAIVFDDAGKPIGMGQYPFEMVFPADGWVEQEPEVLWQTTLQSARDALTDAGLNGADIAAIGITNQRETTLVWDRGSGECVGRAIVWQDRRTAEWCQWQKDNGAEAQVRALTGLLIDPYFSASKLVWMLEQNPDLRDRAERGELCFGTVDTYLIWRLTGGARHVTDATNASRTMLFDIHRQTWSSELADLFAVPESMLPEVLDSAASFGTAKAEWLGAEIPITGVAGDQQAALIGQGCFAEGQSKSTYGTGCFAMTNTGTHAPDSKHALLTTVAYRVAGQASYALEGSIFVAGQAMQWLRDGLGLLTDVADSASLWDEVNGDSAGVYLVPAFTGLGAPHWQPNARGTLVGLTLDSTRAHVVTAALQSVAYQTYELLEAMAADGAKVTQLRVDGGMVVNDRMCQFLADVLNVEVQRPEVVETTALGAAILAAVGVGDVQTLEQAGERWQLERAFSPTTNQAQRERLIKGWQQAVAQTLVGC